MTLPTRTERPPLKLMQQLERLPVLLPQPAEVFRGAIENLVEISVPLFLFRRLLLLFVDPLFLFADPMFLVVDPMFLLADPLFLVGETRLQLSHLSMAFCKVAGKGTRVEHESHNRTLRTTETDHTRISRGMSGSPSENFHNNTLSGATM